MVPDYLRFPVAFLIMILIGLSVLLPPVYFLKKVECNAKTESFENRFGFFEGCQIKHNGRWVDWDQFRPTYEKTEE